MDQGHGHQETGTATLGSLAEGTAALSKYYSSACRAKREKIAIKVTVEHPWRGLSWLRGWWEHRHSAGVSRVWGCPGCCYLLSLDTRASSGHPCCRGMR